MLAAFAAALDPVDPLVGLRLGQRPEPDPALGWVRVRLVTAALNQHDIWSLRGVGLSADRLPMILGCDGAGVDEEGREVIVHAVVASAGWTGDETLDPARTLLSERHAGTLAEWVVVPRGNTVAKPEGLSWEHAACLPTAWLTAYRMLFVRAGLTPGATVLVQGAGGGVATALVQLGAAAGLRVWVTCRDPDRGEHAVSLGAHRAFASGARLPERVDAVMDSVGAATWSHSVNCLKPGAALVICGATSGDAPTRAELTKIFFRQLQVLGSTMGTRAELERLTAMVVALGIRPAIDSVHPLSQVRVGLQRLADGEAFGKVVVRIS